MRMINRPKMLAMTLLAVLLLLPCGLLAQSKQQVWCLKTDKGHYIEMSRVKKFAKVDKENKFNVVFHEGSGATGVQSVTFEKHVPVLYGDADGDGSVTEDDFSEILNDILSESNKFQPEKDVNLDGKVNIVDLVMVLDIINKKKAGTRGLLAPFSQQLSTSNDVPGTISQDDLGGDEAGRTKMEDEYWTMEPLPGLKIAPYNTVRVPDPDSEKPEPNTIEPEPEEITPQQEPVANPDLGSVPYFCVQFTENLKDVKAHAADGYTFFNPAKDNLDFKYYLPFTHDKLSGIVDATADYYIGTGPDPSKDRTQFILASDFGPLAIKQVTAYNQPIKTITVSSSREPSEVEGVKKITYTFNALPRNIEELKTLEVNDREYFKSPHFVTALFICCLNRLPDNSTDTWEMINYLRTHTATVGEDNITKVYYGDTQNIVQNLLDNDTHGFPSVNGLRSYFAGSSPDNKYTHTPTTPYQVTIVEKSDVYTTKDGNLYARLYVESSGYDDPVGPLRLRKVEGHDWLVYSGETGFTKKMKPQN